jgi:murein DD-endopeptidase MepM/ murein hydrolase activator NlpD
MSSTSLKRFTGSFLFRNIETIFLIFLIAVLAGGMTVYFAYGFSKANEQMHTLKPTVRDEFLFRKLSSLMPKDMEISETRRINSSRKPLEFLIYPLRRGDTLKSLAARHGINFDTIVSVNNIRLAANISVGKPLLIANQVGIYYRVRKGDTMTKIAKRFSSSGVSEEAIQSANDLDSRDLMTGESIFIPGGRLTRNQREKVLGLEYAVPVVGRVVSGVGWRTDPFHGKMSFHPGVDIAAPYGRKVYAGRSGRVKYAGWLGGYGLCVIILHSGGYETRYGHLSKVLVQAGRFVDRNTVIGRVGSTGRSVGPHLHFEVRQRDRIINPFRYHGLNRRMWWR